MHFFVIQIVYLKVKLLGWNVCDNATVTYYKN